MGNFWILLPVIFTTYCALSVFNREHNPKPTVCWSDICSWMRFMMEWKTSSASCWVDPKAKHFIHKLHEGICWIWNVPLCKIGLNVKDIKIIKIIIIIIQLQCYWFWLFTITVLEIWQTAYGKCSYSEDTPENPDVAWSALDPSWLLMLSWAPGEHCGHLVP